MSEEIKETEVVEEVKQDEVEVEEQPIGEEKTFTQSELEAIVAQRVAREQKAKEKAVEEAQKLAKMNEEEKREFEFNKLKEELEHLKQKETRFGLSREASNMLAEHSIQADDATLQFVVKDTAEDTQEAVNAFVGLINAKVEQGVKQALSGSAPRVGAVQNQAVTQEQFDKMGYSERVALKKKNEELYNQLIK